MKKFEFQSSCRKYLILILSSIWIVCTFQPSYSQQVQSKVDLDSIANHSLLLLNQQEYGKLLYLLDGYLDTIQQRDFTAIHADLYYLKAKSHEKLGNKKEAYYSFQTYRTIKDSIFNAEKTKEIDSLKSIYFKQKGNHEEIEEKILSIEYQKSIRNKNFLITGIIFFITVSSIVISIWYRNNKKKLLIAKQHLDLADHNQKIKIIESRMKGEKKERIQIARYLHKGIASQITEVSKKFEEAKKKNPNLQTDENFAEVLTIITSAKAQLQQSVLHLSPTTFDIKDELEKFIKHIHEKHQIVYEFYGNASYAPNQLTIFRIIQEIVQNIIKHAKATEAYLSIKFEPEYCELVVSDNGIGINLSEIQKGFGLSSIYSYINNINGNIKIDNKKGTYIYIKIPYQSYNS